MGTPSSLWVEPKKHPSSFGDQPTNLYIESMYYIWYAHYYLEKMRGSEKKIVYKKEKKDLFRMKGYLTNLYNIRIFCMCYVAPHAWLVYPWGHVFNICNVYFHSPYYVLGTVADAPRPSTHIFSLLIPDACAAAHIWNTAKRSSL